MQAELMGHSNEGQRISYMEGMRREMAVVKHVSSARLHSSRKDSLGPILDAIRRAVHHTGAAAPAVIVMIANPLQPIPLTIADHTRN
jgi:plastocyanin domain-containing protein